jgi:hypothetical protein
MRPNIDAKRLRQVIFFPANFVNRETLTIGGLKVESGSEVTDES